MLSKIWHFYGIVGVFSLLCAMQVLAESHEKIGRAEEKNGNGGLRLRRLNNTVLVWNELKKFPEIKFTHGALDRKSDEIIRDNKVTFDREIVRDVFEIDVKEGRKYCITKNDLSKYSPSELGLGLIIESPNMSGSGSHHALNEDLKDNAQTQRLCFTPTESGTIQLFVTGHLSSFGNNSKPYSILVHESRE